MSKTSNINIRVTPELKAEAEELYASFGMTLSEAVTIFLRKSVMEGGLPFELKISRDAKESPLRRIL